MILARLITSLMKARFGEPAEVAEADASSLVLIADGVGGFDLCSFGLRFVVGRGGGPQLVRRVAWGHGWGRWYADLSNVTNHQTQSQALAEQVTTWRTDHPGASVFLVGKSGGTGIVVGALEALPEGSVEAAVLLAPALSPDYNLSKALRAVEREIVMFWSPFDVVTLGLGTLVFGTVDRVHTVSAGLVGFRVPEDLDAESERRYAKLHQVRWTPDMVGSGNLGGHIGTDNPAFLRRYVVPLLRTITVNPDAQPTPGSSHPRSAPIT